MKLFIRFTTLSLAFSLGVITIATTNAAIAQSIRFNAPDLGAPGNREAGASRSAPCTTTNQGLVALLPETNLGLTTEDYPTFFAYVPPSTANTAEFYLYEEGTDELIYSKSLPLSQRSGIVSVGLPSDGSVKPLQLGRNYYWFFTVVCNAEDRSGDMTVQGGIQRVAIDPTLQSQLRAASPQTEPSIYAEAGIWQEAVAKLAGLTRANPNNAEFRAEWRSLLDAVGLTAVANEPLLQ